MCIRDRPKPAPKPDTLVIERPWARATPPGAPVAGGFLTVRNAGKTEDRLVSATSPDADKVETVSYTHLDVYKRQP